MGDVPGEEIATEGVKFFLDQIDKGIEREEAHHGGIADRNDALHDAAMERDQQQFDADMDRVLEDLG